MCLLLHHAASAVTCTHFHTSAAEAVWVSLSQPMQPPEREKFPNMFVSSSGAEWTAGCEMLNPASLSNFALEEKSSTPCSNRGFQPVSTSGRGTFSFSVVLFSTVIHSAQDLCSWNLEMVFSKWRCRDVSGQMWLLLIHVWELPTKDSISNYSKSILICQTTAEKTASVFLNSDERPEHQGLEGNKSPQPSRKPIMQEQSTPEMHTELGENKARQLLRTS